MGTPTKDYKGLIEWMFEKERIDGKNIPYESIVVTAYNISEARKLAKEKIDTKIYKLKLFHKEC